jgi:23S rRNA (adenine2503-C2)-methyltransferase
MPKGNRSLESFLRVWSRIKNEQYQGDAGLQLSINSTSTEEREQMFNGNAISNLRHVASITDQLPDPVGRKYTLNFALAGYEIDAKLLADLFSPDRFICKLTPMHETTACKVNGIETEDGYTSFTPYKETEDALKAEGFDVIVFVPSLDEDQGLITCGNAVLSGRMPECEHSVVDYTKELPND